MRRTLAEVTLRLLFLVLAGVAFYSPPPAPSASAPAAAPAMTLAMARVAPTPSCAEGMVLVEGDFCDEVREECLNERRSMGRPQGLPRICGADSVHRQRNAHALLHRQV